MKRSKRVLLLIICNFVLVACASRTEMQSQENHSVSSSTLTGRNTTLQAPTLQTPTITVIGEGVNEEFILFVREDDLWRVNINGSDIERLTEGELLNWNMGGDDWRVAALSRPVQLSPNGKWIVFSPTGYDLILINVSSREVTNLPDPGAPIAVWSHDSQYLAYAPDYERLYIYDIENQTAMLLLGGDIESVINMVWSPDNRYIAFGCCFQQSEDGVSIGEIRRVDVIDGGMEVVGELWSSVGGGSPPLCWLNETEVAQVESQIEQPRYCSYAAYPAISPVGKQRATLQPASSEDIYWQGASLLTVEDVQTGVLLWQQELTENVIKVLWGRDGRYLLLDDGQNHSPIWRIQADGESPIEIVVSDGYLLDVLND